MKLLPTLLSIVFGASSVSGIISKQPIMRCMDTNFNAGIYGPSGYGATYHPSRPNLCGGDPLIGGQVRIKNNGKINVDLEGAHPWNLYEVFFLPLGGDPTSNGDLLYVGAVLTNMDGIPVNKIVRRITVPNDVFSSAHDVKLSDVGSANQTNSGQFLFYSRGPYASGLAENPIFNTSDGSAVGTFNNPILWGGNNNMYDGVQFISA